MLETQKYLHILVIVKNSQTRWLDGAYYIITLHLKKLFAKIGWAS